MPHEVRLRLSQGGWLIAGLGQLIVESHGRRSEAAMLRHGFVALPELLRLLLLRYGAFANGGLQRPLIDQLCPKRLLMSTLCRHLHRLQPGLWLQGLHDI